MLGASAPPSKNPSASEEAMNPLLQRVAGLFADDQQFLAAQPDLSVAESIIEPELGLTAVIRLVCESYSERPALGQRPVGRVGKLEDGCAETDQVPAFETVSYRELWNQASALARALVDIGVRAGLRVATLGAPSIGYTIVDVAVALCNAVAVPLPTSSPIDVLRPMVAETEPTVMCCSVGHVADAVQLCLASEQITTLVVFDANAEFEEHREALAAARMMLDTANADVLVETASELVIRGAASSTEVEASGDPNRLALVIYTSGSSGAPKGAMHSERLVAGAWKQAAATLVRVGFAVPAITLNYLPMSHIGGRSMLYATLGVGGTAYFAARADLSTLLDDLSSVRPTQLNFVPRVWELLHAEYQRQLALRSGSENGCSDLESVVMGDFRERVLGGRYISALTGSAPLSSVLETWVERLLGMHVINGLGATESGPVIVDGRVQRPPVIGYKLIDVPELGYLRTDQPHPRGELAIKSETMFVGYYARPGLTAEVFDDEGFYRTGDIVAELGADQLQYVDRRNNVVKLAQGEFIAVSNLETLFGNCDLVNHIHIYADSTKSYPVAVIVPTAEALLQFDDVELKRAIALQLRAAGQLAGLQSYEIPRDFIVERESFTVANGLLTGVGKLSRPALMERYRHGLEQLYLDVADAEEAELNALRTSGADEPPIETIRRAAAALLSTVGATPDSSDHFTDLGGDSLSALTFANLIGEIYGIDLPVGVIINPINDLASLARYVDAERTGRVDRVTAASVHGRDPVELCAADLQLSAFIDESTLQAASALAAPPDEVRSVLLTGGNGFLGRYLTLEWLERMSAVGGKLTCLVRAADDRSAYQRLERGFDTGDERLLNRFRGFAADHLEVVAGDKSERKLGLSQATWDRMTYDVDVIVDAAAMVNHVLPYEALFAPNVAGTAELLRIALTGRRKRFSFVSTIGVCAAMQADDMTEDADVRSASPRRPIDDTYANGYANSKWAGEVLLREAHETYGLPVTIHRCGMILATDGYAGQLNLPDTVTRLLFSVLVTGLAPKSFYQFDSAGDRQRAHFDGLPVDFVSEAIASSTSNLSEGYSTFHVLNPHDDGIGLDEYVDWLIAAGCRIVRIADYDTWYVRFRSALMNLPEARRAASVLPLLHAYRHAQHPMRGTFAPTERFRQTVRDARIGTTGDIPHVRASDIVKYQTDLRRLGWL